MKTYEEILPPAMISLREAGRLVATAFFDGDVPSNLYDGNHRAPVLAVERALMDAFMSGQVSVTLDQDGQYSHRPSAEELNHFASRIDFATNTITLGRFPGEAWNAIVNGPELRKFISTQRASVPASNPATREADCLDWLLGQFAAHTKKTKQAIAMDAKPMFSISNRQFLRLWKEAASRPGNESYARPGRPRNP